MIHFLLVLPLVCHSSSLFCAEDSGHIPHVFLEKPDPNEYKNKYYDIRDFIKHLNCTTPEEIGEQLCKKHHLIHATLSDFVKNDSPVLTPYVLRHTNALHAAIETGNLPAVTLLLQKGASLEWRDQHKTPLLICALKMEHAYKSHSSAADRTTIANLMMEKTSCSAPELLVWITDSLNNQDEALACHLLKRLAYASKNISDIPIITRTRHIKAAIEQFFKKNNISYILKAKKERNDTLVAYANSYPTDHSKTSIYLSSPLARTLEKCKELKHIQSKIAQQKQHGWPSPDLTPWPVFAQHFALSNKALETLYAHFPLEPDCWAPFLVNECRRHNPAALEIYCRYGALEHLRYLPLLPLALYDCTPDQQKEPDIEKTMETLLKYGSFIMSRYPDDAGDCLIDIIKKKQLLSYIQIIKRNVPSILSHAQRDQATALITAHLISNKIINPSEPIADAHYKDYETFASTHSRKPPKLSWQLHTILHYAAGTPDTELMNILSKHYAKHINPHARNQKGLTHVMALLDRLAHSGNNLDIFTDVLECYIKKDSVCPPAELAWHLNNELNKHCSRDSTAAVRACAFGQLCKQYTNIQSMAFCRYVKQEAPSWRPQQTPACTTFFEEYAALHQLPLTILSPDQISDTLSDEYPIIYLAHSGDSRAASMCIQYPLSKAIDERALEKVENFLKNNHSVDVLVNSAQPKTLIPLWVYAIKQALTRTDKQNDRYAIAKKILQKKKPYAGEWAIQLARAIKEHDYDLAHTLCKLDALVHNQHLPFIAQLLLHANPYDDKQCEALLRIFIANGVKRKLTISVNMPDAASTQEISPLELAKRNNMPRCAALLAQKHLDPSYPMCDYTYELKTLRDSTSRDSSTHRTRPKSLRPTDTIRALQSDESSILSPSEQLKSSRSSTPKRDRGTYIKRIEIPQLPITLDVTSRSQTPSPRTPTPKSSRSPEKSPRDSSAGQPKSPRDKA